MAGSWYTSPAFRRGALWLGLLLLLPVAINSIFFRDNDFLWHYDFGSLFLQREERIVCGEWYLLGRRMLNGLLPLLPYRVARFVIFALAVGCLVWVVREVSRLAQSVWPIDRATATAASIFAVAGMFPLLLRDFQDCGLQLLLLAMLTAGASALHASRPVVGGFWLGLAAVYKTTPALFLGVLVWKRQWRAAGVMAACLVLLNLLPVLHLGPTLTWRCHQQTLQRFVQCLRVEDIAENSIEPPNLKNQGLMAGFARYLQSYPPGHPMYLDHPAFWQVGNLDRPTARAVARGCMIALGLFLAFSLWGRSVSAREFLSPWAGLCILTALLSPLCWRHHLVLVLPALYLAWHIGLNAQAPRWLVGLLTLSLVVVWLPQRELLGSWATVLMAAKLDTWLFLGWAVLLVARVVNLPSVTAGEQAQPQARLAA